MVSSACNENLLERFLDDELNFSVDRVVYLHSFLLERCFDGESAR